MPETNTRANIVGSIVLISILLGLIAVAFVSNIYWQQYVARWNTLTRITAVLINSVFFAIIFSGMATTLFASMFRGAPLVGGTQQTGVFATVNLLIFLVLAAISFIVFSLVGTYLLYNLPIFFVFTVILLMIFIPLVGGYFKALGGRR